MYKGTIDWHFDNFEKKIGRKGIDDLCKKYNVCREKLYVLSERVALENRNLFELHILYLASLVKEAVSDDKDYALQVKFYNEEC